MRHEYQDQGGSQKADVIEWNKRGKTAACIWKIPAISWWDRTYNLIMVPSCVKSPLTSCRVAWIQGYTERRHTDVRRPKHCKATSTWICLHISVTSAHIAWFNTHISGLWARHQASWCNQSDTRGLNLQASNNEISPLPNPRPPLLELTPLTSVRGALFLRPQPHSFFLVLTLWFE